MKEVAVIILVFSTFMAGLSIARVIYEDEYGELHKIVKECEAKLPRNENCIIIAVPEKIKGE